MWSSRRCRILSLPVAVVLALSCGSSTDPSANAWSVTVDSDSAGLLLRGTMQLTVDVRDGQGNKVSDSLASFSSSNAQVAAVDAHGLVTGVGEGTATITARVGEIQATTAVTVSTLDVTSVSAGFDHNCALTSAGKAYCWGYPQNGLHSVIQPGHAVSYTQPRPVKGDFTFHSIAAGFEHTCALSIAGKAYCWGANEYGQLGNGTTSGSDVPTEVSTDVTFKSLSIGGGHTCGLTLDGVAYCWGSNSSWLLGDGSNVDRSVPVLVSGDLRFTQLSAGVIFSCGILEAGEAYCWGNNRYGQFGNGTDSGGDFPVPAASGLLFESISSGSSTACGVTAEGDGYCWGRNDLGQLGDGSTIDRWSPVLVSGGLKFQSLSSAPWRHSCGVTTDDAGYCWGFNEEGQLGDGSTVDRLAPVPVSGGHAFASLGAGDSHGCGLTLSGSVLCWGGSVYGQLGNGSAAGSQLTPVRIIGSK